MPLPYQCPDCRDSYATPEMLATHQRWHHAPKGKRQATKRVRRRLKLEVSREPLPVYAWPGGYDVIYWCADGGNLCGECVNKEIRLIDDAMRSPGTDRQWEIRYVDNASDYEEVIFCGHCNKTLAPESSSDE